MALLEGSAGGKFPVEPEPFLVGPGSRQGPERELLNNNDNDGNFTRPTSAEPKALKKTVVQEKTTTVFTINTITVSVTMLTYTK